MSIKGLAHVAIQAKDYQATLAFYTEVLEFKVAHHWSLPAFKINEACMLLSPDQRTCIELFDDEAVIAAQGKKRSVKRMLLTVHCCIWPSMSTMPGKHIKKPLLMEQRPV